MNRGAKHGLTILSLPILFFMSTRISGLAQTGQEGSRAQRGFYIGVFYTGLNTPTFRLPSGGEEIAGLQSASLPGFMAGYQYESGPIGLGARVVYWHTSLQNFVVPQMPGSLTMVSYADPAFTHITLDLLIEWICAQRLGVGIYGLLGLGSSTESYTISGSDFPDWNGQKRLSEFDYSYGFGAKFAPLKWISLIAEIRWMPGDKTSEFEFSYSEGGWDYYHVTDTYTTNYTTLASAGLSLHF